MTEVGTFVGDRCLAMQVQLITATWEHRPSIIMPSNSSREVRNPDSYMDCFDFQTLTQNTVQPNKIQLEGQMSTLPRM